MSAPPTAHLPIFADVRAIVFDLDGVLVDSEEVNVRSAFEAFAERGHSLRDDDTRQIVGRHPVDYVPLLASRFGLAENAQRDLLSRQNVLYARLWTEHARLEDDVGEVLPRLEQRGHRMALATSAGRKHARHCLERYGLSRYFELVLTKDDVSRRKPDPEIYLACARRLETSPCAMVVIEDSAHGVAAARRAGARVVAVRTRHVAPHEIETADAIVDTLSDLLLLVP